MKKLSLTLLFLAICMVGFTQEKELQKPETFEMEWEGETITMQKYFIVFLKKGANRNQSQDEARKIQEQHLAYLGKLYKKAS